MDREPRKLVVAIDFGTTYSGYAFSFRSDFKTNPTEVFTVNYKVGSMQMPKMPTSVLFSPDGRFHSFGSEAEEKYAELSDDRKEAGRWYFFDRFKLKLHCQETLNRGLKLVDKTKKKEMPALDVFSAAIDYMKKHCTKELKKQRAYSYVPESEITWVLTVPAIWDDGAKEFMREAAQQAGIPRGQLMLALEPEAASVFCLERYKSEQTLSKPGKKFILVDCGGGTIDISAFEVRDGNRLKHLHQPEGTCQGGTQVDAAFKEFLFQLNVDLVMSFDNMEWLLLMREFENTKRSLTTADNIFIKLPATIQGDVEEAVKNIGKDPDSKSYEFQGKVSVLHNMIRLDRNLFLSFFQKSADSILITIEKVLNQEKVGSVDAILLAGGFSESDVIQDAVREAFPRDLVLVAPSPSAAVLTGAVMYGHNPATRVSAFTYEVESPALFKDDVHDKSRLRYE